MVMVLVISRAVPSLIFLTLVPKPKFCRHRPPAMVHRRRRDLAHCRLVMFTAKGMCSIVLHAPSDRIVSNKINTCSLLFSSMSKSVWTIKGVFGSPAEHRFSQLIPDFSTFGCLVGWVGSGGHCPPHTEKGSQPCPVEKLKSSFSTRPS